MLVRYADWKNPTDHAYAFRLRGGEDGFAPRLPPPGTVTDVTTTERRVLGDEGAKRFAEKIDRWTGPEDLHEGVQPYATVQRAFEERRAAPGGVRAEALEEVLRGTVLALRRQDGSVDYVLRDHHTLDVLLYEYAATGRMPTRLFHADRHSDWCQDAYLEARRPQQAATWWRLAEGLKRPDGAPVLRERDVIFTTAVAPARDQIGREIGAAMRVPGCVDASALSYREVLAHPELSTCDWVSLDLDYFQPAAQLRMTSGLLRDDRFQTLIRSAAVRLFVISPQFASGADRIKNWVVHGTRSSTLRLLNLLLRLGG